MIGYLSAMMLGCHDARVSGESMPGCHGVRVPGCIMLWCQSARVPGCQNDGCQGARLLACHGAMVPRLFRMPVCFIGSVWCVKMLC